MDYPIFKRKIYAKLIEYLHPQIRDAVVTASLICIYVSGMADYFPLTVSRMSMGMSLLLL